MSLRFLVLTSHFFAPSYRKAGMHQFAFCLAEKGHHVDFITVGQSRLKQLMKPSVRAYARATDAGPNPPNIRAHVQDEAWHPPSGSRVGELLTRALIGRYGRRLDAIHRDAARAADVVILECGYPLFYFDALKAVNARAKYIAFYNDRLDVVGFRPEVLALHQRLMTQFDMVRTNAQALLADLPPGSNGHHIPQGVDKSQIRADCASPYAPGTRNIVSVGNMLFDDRVVRRIAATAAELGAELHVIGARMADPPPNIRVHGELPFDRTVPYIVHADAGLAPYRQTAGTDYLVQSSLKLQQYLYCGLPILLPCFLDMQGPSFFRYDPLADDSIAACVRQALARGRADRLQDDVPGWGEVGDQLLEAIAALG